MKKFTLIVLTLILSVFALSCAQENNANKNVLALMASDESFKARLLAGDLTSEELSSYVKTVETATVKPYEPSNGNLSMPETGTLGVAVKNKKSGYINKIVLKSGSTRLPVLTIGDGKASDPAYTEVAFHSGTRFIVELYSQKANGSWYIVRSDNPVDCKVKYYKNEARWEINFADTQGGSHGDRENDYNDVVLNIHVLPTPFIDRSDRLQVKIDYLNYHDLNAQGYAIYYIGETMKYKVTVTTLKDTSFKDKTYTVYVLHEYFEDITCNRTWYQLPLRPADEPQTISVKKGDPLPGQFPIASWYGYVLSTDAPLVLNGSYTSTRAICAGNDQTRVIIVCESDNGQVELKIYDNPIAGVFDPPAGE